MESSMLHSFSLTQVLFVGAATTVAAVVCAFAILIYLRKCSKLFVYAQRAARSINDRLIRQRSLVITAHEIWSSTIQFQYNEMVIATNNFSQKIGRGGFGSVFKGQLPDGRFIAVKRLEFTGHGESQFAAEVATIGNIHHYNLVELVGYCHHRSERLLVYEYMENGSLDQHIFYEPDNADSSILSWEQRFQAALGTARGIAYLHDGCRKHIIHCDVKPENVLLDKNFTPKVSDFGMAKLLDKEENRAFTVVRGTRGYLAPEWLFGNTGITDKIDVYSFGMVLLELMSGRKNVDIKATSSTMYFPAWAYDQVKYDKYMNLLDARVIVADADIEQVRRMAYVALWCIQEEVSARPTMAKVLKYLEGETQVPEPPVPFYRGTDGSPDE